LLTFPGGALPLLSPRKPGLALVLFAFSQESAVWLGVWAMPSAVERDMYIRIRRAINKFDAHGGTGGIGENQGRWVFGG
jgi:hypothetical protein